MPVYDHDARNQVSIDIEAITRQVARYTDEGIKAVAEEAAARAKGSIVFTDKTGTLRKSIKAQKSKRNKDDEVSYIVKAGAPHAHLIEYGHAQVTQNGDVIGHVAAHPFLQPAVDSVMPEAENIAAVYLRKMNIKV